MNSSSHRSLILGHRYVLMKEMTSFSGVRTFPKGTKVEYTGVAYEDGAEEDVSENYLVFRVIGIGETIWVLDGPEALKDMISLVPGEI